MERDCSKLICGAPMTFQGYGIEQTRINLWDCFAREKKKLKAELHKTDLHICSYFRGKLPFYNQINTVIWVLVNLKFEAYPPL